MSSSTERHWCALWAAQMSSIFPKYLGSHSNDKNSNGNSNNSDDQQQYIIVVILLEAPRPLVGSRKWVSGAATILGASAHGGFFASPQMWVYLKIGDTHK